jgi:hypothetical protein
MRHTRHYLDNHHQDLQACLLGLSSLHPQCKRPTQLLRDPPGGGSEIRFVRVNVAGSNPNSINTTFSAGIRKIMAASITNCDTSKCSVTRCRRATPSNVRTISNPSSPNSFPPALLPIWARAIGGPPSE